MSRLSFPGEVSRKLLNIVFPLGRCRICKGEVKRGLPELCSSCLKASVRIGENVCSSCGRELPASATAGACGICLREPPAYKSHISVYSYEGPVRELVLLYKTGKRYPFAGLMGRRISRAVERRWHTADFDCVTFVPATLLRRVSRGFAPAELIAGHCSRDTGIQLMELLCTKRSIRPQKGLDSAERAQNVKGAFECRGKKCKGLRVLLIDDIFTTGATIGEAAATLADEGAEVYAATFAMRLKRTPELSGAERE